MARWTFRERGGWVDFDADAARKCEDAFKSHKSTCQSTFFNPRTQKQTVYEYDLVNMKQTNTETQYVREIQRHGGKRHCSHGHHGHHATAAHTTPPAGAMGFGGVVGPHGGFHPGYAESLQYLATSGPSQADAKTLTEWQEVQDIGEDETCALCMCEFDKASTAPGDVAVLFSKCSGHYFHKECAENPAMLQGSWLRCPVCSTLYGVQTGAQPSGTMEISASPYPCDGYPSATTISIQYHFPHGIQTEGMPAPGHAYSGTHRTAYLPDTPEGREVLELLKTAFRRGLVFVVGQSVTTGADNTVVWNGVHHKTHTHGGAARYGYPDPTYFSRVKEELAAKGVVSGQP